MNILQILSEKRNSLGSISSLPLAIEPESQAMHRTQSVCPRLVQRPLTQLVRLAIGASASGLMLGAYAQSSGNACATVSASACLISSIGASGANGPTADFDKSGNPGGAGTSGNSVSAVFNGSNPGAYVSSGNASPLSPGYSAIGLESLGGSGGNGSNASGSQPLAVPNLSAGSGGTAGSAGDASLFIAQGAQVQAVMTNPPPALVFSRSRLRFQCSRREARAVAVACRPKAVIRGFRKAAAQWAT